MGDLLLFTFTPEEREVLYAVPACFAYNRCVALLVAGSEPYLSLGQSLSEHWQCSLHTLSPPTSSGLLRDSLHSQLSLQTYSNHLLHIKSLLFSQLQSHFKVVFAPRQSVECILQVLGLKSYYPAALVAVENRENTARVVKSFMKLEDFEEFVLNGSLRRSCNGLFQALKPNFAPEITDKTGFQPSFPPLKLEFTPKFGFNSDLTGLNSQIKAYFDRIFDVLPKENDLIENWTAIKTSVQFAIDDLEGKLRIWIEELHLKSNEMREILHGNLRNQGKEIREVVGKINPGLNEVFEAVKGLETGTKSSFERTNSLIGWENSLLNTHKSTLSSLLSLKRSEKHFAEIEDTKTKSDGVTLTAIVRFRKEYPIPCDVIMMTSGVEHVVEVGVGYDPVNEVVLGRLDVLVEGEYQLVVRGKDGKVISPVRNIWVESRSFMRAFARKVEGYMSTVVYTLGNIEEVEIEITNNGGEAALAEFRNLAVAWQNPQPGDVPRFIETAKLTASEGPERMRPALETCGFHFI